jgi:phage terminase Nu1 subunit (DNA packaging protein)
MTLYTSKVVAQWLCLTERRVRQLRDEGVISEARPGLYDLQQTVARYIQYLGGAGKENLNEERRMLTRAKREAAEMENQQRRGNLHATEDFEAGLKTMLLNMRSRLLVIPAALSQGLSEMGGDRAGIFDKLKAAIDEALEELSQYSVTMAIPESEEERLPHQ